MKILLIGQGIAGTLLAWTLRKKGLEVHVADGNLIGASSLAAAGIINPVTGKRFAKSWRFDEFYPIAKSTYHQLEHELGISIWEERPTLRLLGTPEEANDWSLRCGQPEYTDLLGETTEAGPWNPYIKPGFHIGLIYQSARAKLPALLSSYREALEKEGLFSAQKIDYQEVESLLRTYDRVVFCEGWRAQTNPYFPDALFRVCKGEALIIRFREETAEQPTQMLKKTLLAAPMGDGTYWVGSTYNWTFKDTLPDPESREYLLGYLKEMLEAPFEIVDHVAGIRPTMIDRRPVVGPSAINPNVYIFNGLGTKGALLAPYFAHQLADQICAST